MKVHQKEYTSHRELLSKFEKFKANYDLVEDLNEIYKYVCSVFLWEIHINDSSWSI